MLHNLYLNAEFANKKDKQYFTQSKKFCIQGRQRENSSHRWKLLVHWCSLLLRHFSIKGWCWYGTYILLQSFFHFYQVLLSWDYCASCFHIRRGKEIWTASDTQSNRVMGLKNKIMGEGHSLLGHWAWLRKGPLYAYIFPIAHEAHRQKQSRGFRCRWNLLFNSISWSIPVFERM